MGKGRKNGKRAKRAATKEPGGAGEAPAGGGPQSPANRCFS